MDLTAQLFVRFARNFAGRRKSRPQWLSNRTS